MLDLRAYMEPEKTQELIQGRCRLGVDYGERFGAEYRGFIRLNHATDPAYVKQDIERIIIEINAG